MTLSPRSIDAIHTTVLRAQASLPAAARPWLPSAIAFTLLSAAVGIGVWIGENRVAVDQGRLEERVAALSADIQRLERVVERIDDRLTGE